MITTISLIATVTTCLFMVVMQGLIIYNNDTLNNTLPPDSNDNKTISTILFINIFGFLVPTLMAGIVINFMLKPTYYQNSYIFITLGIFCILYLAITIATCVYVYKLPVSDQNANRAGCDCSFEESVAILKVLSITATVVTAIYGVILISFGAYDYDSEYGRP